jgi:hypothetical protein
MSTTTSSLRRAVDNSELVDVMIYVIDQPRARDIVALGQRPPAPHRPVDPLRTLIIRSATADTLRRDRVIDPIVASFARDDIDVSLRAGAASVNGCFTKPVLRSLHQLDQHASLSATNYVDQAAGQFPDIAWHWLVNEVGVEELRALGTALCAQGEPPSLDQLGRFTGHHEVTDQLHLIVHDAQSIIDLTIVSQLDVMLATHPNDWPASVAHNATRALASWRQAHVGLSVLDVLHDLRSEPGLSDHDRRALATGVMAMVRDKTATDGAQFSVNGDALHIAHQLAFHPLTPRSVAALARRTIDTLEA